MPFRLLPAAALVLLLAPAAARSSTASPHWSTQDRHVPTGIAAATSARVVGPNTTPALIIDHRKLPVMAWPTHSAKHFRDRDVRLYPQAVLAQILSHVAQGRLPVIDEFFRPEHSLPPMRTSLRRRLVQRHSSGSDPVPITLPASAFLLCSSIAFPALLARLGRRSRYTPRRPIRYRTT